MGKKMLIDATHAEETRVVVVDGNKVEEFDFEAESRRQLAGNIYLAKVTRVEPSLQAAFVDYGGNRHGFLAFSEIHPDYYQIPVADREALMEEERAYAEALRARDEAEVAKSSKPRRRSRSKTKAEDVVSEDAVETKEVEIDGMETIDLSDETETDADIVPEGSSPMETVAETPVAEPEPEAEDDGADAAEAAEAEIATEETAEVEEAAAEADVSEGENPADETPVDETPEAAPEAAADDASEDTDDADDEADDTPKAKGSDASKKDESIESVADDDDSEDIRPPRKPRPRRYKIQEVVKVRQVMLVQVVKEERGNKGAALTTYLSLAGRYCVLMPNTARGGGISRKITNATDRKKLKDIAAEIDVPSGAGLIVRTAGAKRTKAEIKRDYEYLQRLWEQIRELTLKSIAPAKIYEEGDLVKRSIRDLYNRDIDEVLVEGEAGYRTAKDFMKMIMPSHAKNVQRYEDALPLFARYQVETYLAGMFNPVVQLKSGGYIVIGVTEALVAIDVNSGRATKEASIEETALKTNLEAADEVARQLRLRDLAGLIVIDFIDMDERKNNSAVEKRMKDRLKTDRARIQVGRISGFGLMEMSRQRLRPGMIEATTQPCPSCHGTGLIRSDDNMALAILRQIEEEGTRRRTREVLVRCPVNIANFLMNQKREHIAQIESRYGLSVRLEGDAHLVSPDFSIEKFKTATRIVAEVAAPVVSVDTSLMDQIDADEAEAPTEAEAQSDAEAVDAESEAKPKRKRRRRRKRKGNRSDDGAESTEAQEASADSSDDQPAEGEPAEAEAETAPDAGEGEESAKPKRTRRSRSRKKKTDDEVQEAAPEAGAETDAAEAAGDAPVSDDAVAVEAETPDAVVEKPKRRTRKRAAKKDEAPVEQSDDAPAAEVVTEAAEEAPVADDDAPVSEPEIAAAPGEAAAEPETPSVAAEVAEEVGEPETAEPAPEPVVEAAPEPVLEAVAETPEPEAKPAKPKRRGWWSLGS
ncbi:Rne/Rng family ribonuclease [Ruegeria sp. 2205SS24-7]|uniref:Rne/Rng family ribonuclease n=1 Tax=Ruegeria discodermiae TaxID=3064389 RepID=UPI0027425041|nr:Rne/Rng family ribonuclease [Ruegeria sp. 2205SS24-7]MDP5216476.1 Rne/Rng family ribonuclease [Ruegeria sp. 2205SS24-7]